MGVRRGPASTDGARPTLVLAAHGTRSSEGEQTLRSLTEVLRRQRPDTRVELAYLEISRPLLADLLPTISGPVTVVPLLLAGGYHVHIDLPEILSRTRPDAVLARPLGPHPLLARALARRLIRAGLRATDAVILGAAGSSDPAALADVRATARLLAVRLARPVSAAFASTGSPTVAEAIERARSGPATRVALASCLLAPGFFHTRLEVAGADLVSSPLGADTDVAALAWTRFDEATTKTPFGNRAPTPHRAP